MHTALQILAFCWSSGNAFVSGTGGLRFKSLRSNQTQCCQQLTAAATFLQKELCCQDAMTQRWAPQTHYTLQRIIESITKDLT